MIYKVIKMIRIKLLILLTICVENIQCQMCTRLDNLPKTEQGLRVKNRGVTYFTSISYMQCGIECLKRNVCISFNYNIYNHSCTLNFEDFIYSNNIQPDPSYIVTSIAGFPKHLAGKCENHHCENNETCVEMSANSSKGYKCERNGCPVPQVVNNATLVGTESLIFRSVAYYECAEDYEPFNNTYFSTCNNNHLWTEFKCKRRIRSCTELNQCRYGSLDGEYWLFPANFGDKRVKIYCKNMYQAPSQPRSYVTLDEKTNMFLSNCNLKDNFPQKNIFYERLGVDLQTMIINPKDFTYFALGQIQFNIEFLGYGIVGDCSDLEPSSCNPSRLLINTTGTGLILNDTSEWVIYHKNTQNDIYDSVINHVYKSIDNRVLEISCSGGCGGCHPALDLSFQYDDTYDINIDDAIDPICFD